MRNANGTAAQDATAMYGGLPLVSNGELANEVLKHNLAAGPPLPENSSEARRAAFNQPSRTGPLTWVPDGILVNNDDIDFVTGRENEVYSHLRAKENQLLNVAVKGVYTTHTWSGHHHLQTNTREKLYMLLVGKRLPVCMPFDLVMRTTTTVKDGKTFVVGTPSYGFPGTPIVDDVQSALKDTLDAAKVSNSWGTHVKGEHILSTVTRLTMTQDRYEQHRFQNLKPAEAPEMRQMVEEAFRRTVENAALCMNVTLFTPDPKKSWLEHFKSEPVDDPTSADPMVIWQQAGAVETDRLILARDECITSLLCGFRWMKSTSADMVARSGDDGGYMGREAIGPSGNSLYAANEHVRKRETRRYVADVRESNDGRGNDFVLGRHEWILGGWRIGSVQDTTAIRTDDPMNTTSVTPLPTSKMQIAIEIQWDDATRLCEQYQAASGGARVRSMRPITTASLKTLHEMAQDLQRLFAPKPVKKDMSTDSGKAHVPYVHPTTQFLEEYIEAETELEADNITTSFKEYKLVGGKLLDDLMTNMAGHAERALRVFTAAASYTDDINVTEMLSASDFGRDLEAKARSKAPSPAMQWSKDYNATLTVFQEAIDASVKALGKLVEQQKKSTPTLQDLSKSSDKAALEEVMAAVNMTHDGGPVIENNNYTQAMTGTAVYDYLMGIESIEMASTTVSATAATDVFYALANPPAKPKRSRRAVALAYNLLKGTLPTGATTATLHDKDVLKDVMTVTTGRHGRWWSRLGVGRGQFGYLAARAVVVLLVVVRGTYASRRHEQWRRRHELRRLLGSRCGAFGGRRGSRPGIGAEEEEEGGGRCLVGGCLTQRRPGIGDEGLEGKGSAVVLVGARGDVVRARVGGEWRCVPGNAVGAGNVCVAAHGGRSAWAAESNREVRGARGGGAIRAKRRRTRNRVCDRAYKRLRRETQATHASPFCARPQPDPSRDKEGHPTTAVAAMPPLHTYGPGSQGVGRESFIEGYMPYSRVGELVANARLDVQEWQHLLERSLTDEEQAATSYYQLQLLRRLYETNVLMANARSRIVDARPRSAIIERLPGYIAVQRKGNARNMRSMLVSETAAPVVVCAAGLPKR